jgi:hypothetical protein
MISHMPMQQTPIDGEADAAASGGRRPTVVAASASPSPELSTVRAAGRSPRRTNCASWQRPIAPRRLVVSARSCVARGFTHRLSLTGEGSVTPGPSLDWFLANAARRLPKRTRFRPKWPPFSAIMPVWHSA